MACPHCESDTTASYGKPGYLWCVPCGHVWNTEDAPTGASVEGTFRRFEPLEPAAAPFPTKAEMQTDIDRLAGGDGPLGAHFTIAITAIAALTLEGGEESDRVRWLARFLATRGQLP